MFSSTFQGKFNFQGLFKPVLYIQVLFKPVRTLKCLAQGHNTVTMPGVNLQLLTLLYFFFVWFDYLSPIQQFFSYVGTSLPDIPKQGVMRLAQGHNAMMRVRLEPAAPRSRVKHSTTELPLILWSPVKHSTNWATALLWGLNLGPLVLKLSTL